MENNQPDLFYGGESMIHLVGALMVVLDRDNGNVPSDWEFLREVVRRLEEWRLYQYFYEPGIYSNLNNGPTKTTLYHAGAGYSGRTGNGAPSGQAGRFWKFLSYADTFDDLRHVTPNLPSFDDMQSDIIAQLADRTSEMQDVHIGTPPEWNGWSPWTKNTPFLPQKGWYSRLKSLVDENDISLMPMVSREGVYYNKKFGGSNVGDQYWSHKNSDGENEWGFFVEAQAKQGKNQGGWFGGKIETFWTKATGVLVINRHGKAGCDAGDLEDSTCWDNLETRACHHVWGRNENGAFTTSRLLGRFVERVTVMGDKPPSVTINNVFHDFNASKEEENANVILGEFTITNRIEAMPNGARVTHAIESNATDIFTEMWATVPIFMKLYSPVSGGDQFQRYYNNTSIEYLDESGKWIEMPEDTSGDGIPELVLTMKLRLGRDFLFGNGSKYGYISFEEMQRVRISAEIYYDPYQTKTSCRNVHIDFHGDPGNEKVVPKFKELVYWIASTNSTKYPSYSNNNTVGVVLGVLFGILFCILVIVVALLVLGVVIAIYIKRIHVKKRRKGDNEMFSEMTEKTDDTLEKTEV